MNDCVAFCGTGVLRGDVVAMLVAFAIGFGIVAGWRMNERPRPGSGVMPDVTVEDGTAYLPCGCFYRGLFTAPHRPGWRYRCWWHRLLAWLRLVPAGPRGGL